MKRSFSIRRVLLISILGVLTTLWGALAYLSYHEAHTQVDALLDASLAQSARSHLGRAMRDYRKGHKDHHDDDDDDDGDHDSFRDLQRYERVLNFQILSHDGSVLYRSSESLPKPSLREQTGYFDHVPPQGPSWREFALWSENRKIQVQVYGPLFQGEEIGRTIAKKIAFPILTILPIVALLIFLVIHLAVAPLKRAAKDVASRDPRNLQPLELERAPAEVIPLVESINALMLRLQRTLDGERRFTSDAAHELRTPLAGLKAQAEVALSSNTPDERSHALRQILLAVDRVTHLVGQLLFLARVESQTAEANSMERLSLRGLASEVIEELEPKARHKNLDLSLGEDDAQIHGNQELLRALVRNLLDNSIRYCNAGDRIDISVQREKEHISISVTDTGPGVDEQESSRIFDRFYRGKGAKESGSGLGLSIVKRIAELHGGEVTLTARKPKGLEVRVQFTLVTPRTNRN